MGAEKRGSALDAGGNIITKAVRPPPITEGVRNPHCTALHCTGTLETALRSVAQHRELLIESLS